jgi:hypothetical protein
MEHVSHPCPYIGLSLETVVRVMRIQEVISRVLRLGDWLILLTYPDTLRGFHPLRALHIDDLAHRCILPGEMSCVRSSRAFRAVKIKETTHCLRSMMQWKYSIFRLSNDHTSAAHNRGCAGTICCWGHAIYLTLVAIGADLYALGVAPDGISE